MIKKQSTDPLFEQVSVRLLDATHHNINQKYFFPKKTLISGGILMLISYTAFTFWNIPCQVP